MKRLPFVILWDSDSFTNQWMCKLFSNRFLYLIWMLSIQLFGNVKKIVNYTDSISEFNSI